MTNTEFTGKTKAQLIQQLEVAIKVLRGDLADTLASHDVYERRYGVGTQIREEGQATAYRHALFVLGAGDWDEIDALAESMWPAAMAKLADILDNCAKNADGEHQAESLTKSRDAARQLLAEHEAAKRAAA